MTFMLIEYLRLYLVLIIRKNLFIAIKLSFTFQTITLGPLQRRAVNPRTPEHSVVKDPT